MCKIKIRTAIIVLCLPIIMQAQFQKDTTLESALGLSIEQLMNTKVSIATKSEQSVSEAPAIVTVVTEEVIKNSGARNLADLLQDVPGFEFARSRTGVVNMGVRGVKDILTSARFLVLKDGVPFNDPMYGSGISLSKQFDINSIERIEVIRGPGSALYGRNAFIGVINIITKKSKTNNNVELFTTIGMFNTLSYGGEYGVKKNDFNAFVSAEKITSDITDSKFADGFGDESTWNLGIDNFTTNVNLGYKNLTLTGMFTDIKNGLSAGPFMTESSKNAKIGIYALEYKKALSEKINLSARLYGRNENQNQNVEYLKPGLHPNFPNGAYATPKFKAYNYGIDINTSLKHNEKHYTLAGIQSDFYGLNNVELYSNYDTYNDTVFTQLILKIDGIDTIYRDKNTQTLEERGWIEGNGHDYTNFALYMQHIYNPIKKLSFTLGGRYDYDSEIGGVFNPRIAGVWNTEHNFIFKMLYGQAYRAPNAQEQYRLTGFTKGNKNLKPETIKTTELSIDYNINKNINNRLTFFYNTLNDMIYAYGSSFGATKNDQYRNVGKNTSKGFEYEYKMMLSKQFYMFMNYSFTSSTDEATRNETITSYAHRDIAPHKVNFGVNYRLFNKINLYSGINYRSAREKYFAFDKDGDYILDENGNRKFVSQDKVGDYFLWNAKIRFINLYKGLELSIEGYNLLNTQYYDQDNSNATQPLREGRQLLLSARFTF